MGFVFGSLVFPLISHTLGSDAMLSYGWRLSFLTGVMPVILAIYIRKSLSESPEFERIRSRELLKKLHSSTCSNPRRSGIFWQVFTFMTGLFLIDYSVYGFLPKILTLDGRGFDTTAYSLIYGFALFMAFLGYIFYGWISDYTGRRLLTMNYCIFLIIFGVPSYYVLYHAALARNIGLAIWAQRWPQC